MFIPAEVCVAAKDNTTNILRFPSSSRLTRAVHVNVMAKFKDLVGLLVLLVVICIACFVGYVAYSIANDVAAKTQEKMEKKNIKVSRDGLKVGMKQVSSEQVSDSTQGWAHIKSCPMLGCG